MNENLEIFEETCKSLRDLMKNRNLPDELYNQKIKKLTPKEIALA